MKKGMIKVSVLYPTGDGKNFDLDYYLNSHVPLVTNTLGDALVEATYDKGLSGGVPGSSAPFVAIANLFFNSMAEFGQAFSTGAPILMADLPNFTNIQPVIQINEVIFQTGS